MDFLCLGKFVEPFLSLEISHGNAFEVMNTFCKFDLDGAGRVNIDDFAYSIMERLDTFANNSQLLEEIAYGIMSAGSKSAPELLIIVIYYIYIYIYI